MNRRKEAKEMLVGDRNGGSWVWFGEGGGGDLGQLVGGKRNWVVSESILNNNV